MEVSADSTFAMFNWALEIFEPVAPLIGTMVAVLCVMIKVLTWSCPFFCTTWLVYHWECIKNHSSAGLCTCRSCWRGIIPGTSSYSGPICNLVIFDIVNNFSHSCPYIPLTSGGMQSQLSGLASCHMLPKTGIKGWLCFHAFSLIWDGWLNFTSTCSQNIIITMEDSKFQLWHYP